jgi:predicted nucleotidyltransferase
MNNTDIMKCLEVLNENMKKKNIYGEVSLVGGAVMCLCYKSREVTQDIDAIFEPKAVINKIIQETAEELEMPSNWLNDGVKGFLSKDAEFVEYIKLSNLTINVATPEYMLAMKCLSARADNANEIEDIKYLIEHLEIKNYAEVQNIIFKYYPADRFLVKTKYLLMEVLENVWN